MPDELNGVDLKKLIKRRHPEFEEHEEHWRLAEVAYRGGRAWFDFETKSKNGNLFKFYKEGPQEYESRKERTYRGNHVKRVVETINQYLFRSKPVRKLSQAPAEIQAFWRSTNRKRRPIDAFMQSLDRWLSVFGRVYVVIDRPAPGQDPASLTLQRRDEAAPYAYIVFPHHVLDIAYGEDGRPDWILIEEQHRGASFDEGGLQCRYRLWTRQSWYLIAEEEARGRRERKVQVIDSGDHGLGSVPVVCVEDQEGTNWTTPGICDDIIYMDRTLVNYGSLLDEILYEQTFSQLTMPAESLLPGSNEGRALISAAKERIFLFNATSPGVKPEYISPDASQAALIMSAMNALKRDIYAVTGTDNDANSQSMSKGKEYASGKVREFDHSQIENILLNKSHALETAEEEIGRLVMLWMGQQDAEFDPGLVTYPDKFDIRGLAAELEIAAELNELQAPEEMLRLQMSKVSEKTFPRLNEREKAELEKVIEKWMPAFMIERKFKEEELETKKFIAETQADAMEDDDPSDDRSIEDPENSDLDRKTQSRGNPRAKRKVNAAANNGYSAE